MFTNILLAVDGSSESLAAAGVAGRIAAESRGTITVLTANEGPGSMLGEPEYTELLHDSLEDADAHLDAAVAVVIASGGPDPQRERFEGHATDAILGAAAAGRYDLIVLGNRGRGRIATALLGSVSTAVASRATIPVLIVPHKLG